ncbi:MAG: hypothetical protein J7K26_03650 [Candidatus Aenigmarchaeota archaeon]|nr:hypothetical protein [Candidatus Aenigmarchaeota archaeon]
METYKEIWGDERDKRLLLLDDNPVPIYKSKPPYLKDVNVRKEHDDKTEAEELDELFPPL